MFSVWFVNLEKEEIGDGDGIIIMGLGWAVGPERILEILAGAFLLAGAAGLLCYLRDGKKAMEIPFVPWILFGYWMGEWIK